MSAEPETKTRGSIVGVNGNLLTVAVESPVVQNEVAYAHLDHSLLKSEVIRVRNRRAELQVFEDTAGLKVGDEVDFSGELLAAELGPGLLGQVYDGLQNPLPAVAEECGFFLRRGVYKPSLDRDKTWRFTPKAASGSAVRAGDVLGTVPEGMFEHKIMVPFRLIGPWAIEEIVPEGDYRVEDVVARLTGGRRQRVEARLMQTWPVKLPIRCYSERLRPEKPLVTRIRIIDTFFPIALGGTYCIPGPFGAGKTVLQQITARHAEVDIVVVAACGERAGEVVETLRELPTLTDPKTGRSLMERTLIICNTSSMPIAAREASVYTAATIAEYYRQMGLNVLLLADSTSRWAQALREISGRMEEIPGEEAFPAYLESVIAAFYERGGRVRLNDGAEGSVTIGGTVSPAGGNFDEPVTQSTLKVAGAFHGLSNQRAESRRYPALHPLESWSRYPCFLGEEPVAKARETLFRANEIDQMMKVVGEEGVSLEDFTVYLKGEFLDAVYLQQDAYHPVDAATPFDRQKYVFQKLAGVLELDLAFENKEPARRFFQDLAQACKDWNRAAMDAPEFKELEDRLDRLIENAKAHA